MKKKKKIWKNNFYGNLNIRKKKKFKLKHYSGKKKWLKGWLKNHLVYVNTSRGKQRSFD